MERHTGNPHREREREEARTLWEEIFPGDSASFLDYYDRWKVPENRIQTRHAGGRLVSMIQWNPYRLWVRGRETDSSYLIAVATRPEFRHRGYMSGLLREGLAEEASRGVPFVFLMPADPAIYRPFDFRYIYERSVAEIAPREISGDPALTIRALSPQEYPEAASFLQDGLASRFEVFALRDEFYLRRLQAECASDGGALEGIRDGGRLIGLMAWWGEDPVEIRELVTEPEWERGEKRERLLAALGRRFAGRGRVTAVTTGWTGAQEPIIMGRVADLTAFLRLFSSGTPLTLRLAVKDPILAGNTGIYLWQLAPEGARIRRIGEGIPGQAVPPGAEETAEISMGIADLISWLAGGRAPGELASCRMTAEGARKAEQIDVIRNVFLDEIV